MTNKGPDLMTLDGILLTHEPASDEYFDGDEIFDAEMERHLFRERPGLGWVCEACGPSHTLDPENPQPEIKPADLF
jgi:hypothetical protein